MSYRPGGSSKSREDTMPWDTPSIKTSEAGSTISRSTPVSGTSVVGGGTAWVDGGGVGASGTAGPAAAATCVAGGVDGVTCARWGRGRSSRCDGAGVGATARLVDGVANIVVAAVGGGASVARALAGSGAGRIHQ